MARRPLNLKNQFQYAITKNSKIGTSKRGDRKNNVDTMKYVYSVNRMNDLRDTASNFSRFMKEEFPEIRQVKDIENYHFQAYMEQRGVQWSEATMVEIESRLNKLTHITNDVFHLDKHFNVERPAGNTDKQSGRDKMMTDEHIAMLREHLEAGNSAAKWIPAVASTIGARCEEIMSIRQKDIDLKAGVVHLVNCKNGRDRDVPIRVPFLPLYREIKEFMIANNWETVTNNRSRSAVDNGLRRGMEAVGISEIYPETAVHAMRKNFATHRYQEEKAKGLSKKEAFTIVCKELGHSSYRHGLFVRYIK